MEVPSHPEVDVYFCMWGPGTYDVSSLNVDEGAWCIDG
jgi:hypothetical protein